MLFSQVWADNEKDLVNDFELVTDIPIDSAKEIGAVLRLRCSDIKELHRVSMRDLIGAYNNQQPMTIIFGRKFYEFTKICFAVDEEEVTSIMDMFFTCIKDATNLN